MEQFVINVKELTEKGWKPVKNIMPQNHTEALAKFRTLVYEQINGRFSQPISITLSERVGKEILATFSIR